MVGKLKIFNFFKNRNLFKIKLLIISILIFSVLYSFLNDSHFRGLNLIEDALENKLAENKLKGDITKINEKFHNHKVTSKDLSSVKQISEVELEEASPKVKAKLIKLKEVDKTVSKKVLLQPFYVRYFNRLYFTIVTACLLGYGDIYPYTFICKLLAMIQALLTVSIIVF